MTTPEPPPEAQLIHELREAAVPHLSMREAARRAGISPALWTQIEQGYRKVTSAFSQAISGTDDKIALMAMVVGATPQQLAERGRPGAARALEVLLAKEPDLAAQTIEVIKQSSDLNARQKELLIASLERDQGKKGLPEK